MAVETSRTSSPACRATTEGNPKDQTQHSLYRQDQPHHLAAYGKQPPLSPDPAAWLDFMAAAFWATPGTTVLAYGKIDGAAAENGPQICSSEAAGTAAG